MRNKNQNKTVIFMKKMMTKKMMILIINLQIKISNQTDKSRTNQYHYQIKDAAKIIE